MCMYSDWRPTIPSQRTAARDQRWMRASHLQYGGCGGGTAEPCDIAARSACHSTADVVTCLDGSKRPSTSSRRPR